MTSHRVRPHDTDTQEPRPRHTHPVTIALFPTALSLEEGGVPALPLEANLQKGRAAMSRAAGTWGRLRTGEFRT